MSLCPNCKSEIIDRQDQKILCAVCGWLEAIADGGYRPAEPPQAVETNRGVDMAKKKQIEPEQPAEQQKEPAEPQEPTEPQKPAEQFGVQITFDDD